MFCYLLKLNLYKFVFSLNFFQDCAIENIILYIVAKCIIILNNMTWHDNEN